MSVWPNPLDPRARNDEALKTIRAGVADGMVTHRQWSVSLAVIPGLDRHDTIPIWNTGLLTSFSVVTSGGEFLERVIFRDFNNISRIDSNAARFICDERSEGAEGFARCEDAKNERSGGHYHIPLCDYPDLRGAMYANVVNATATIELRYKRTSPAFTATIIQNFLYGIPENECGPILPWLDLMLYYKIRDEEEPHYELISCA